MTSPDEHNPSQPAYDPWGRPDGRPQTPSSGPPAPYGQQPQYGAPQQPGPQYQPYPSSGQPYQPSQSYPSQPPQPGYGQPGYAGTPQPQSGPPYGTPQPQSGPPYGGAPAPYAAPGSPAPQSGSGYVPGKTSPAGGYGAPPGYQSGGYGGDAYPGYGQPTVPPQPQGGMSTGVKVVLWVIPIVIILAAGGVAFALAGHKGTAKPVAHQSTGPAVPGPGASTAPNPTTTHAAGSVNKYTMPKKLLGMSKTQDPSLAGVGKSLAGTLGKDATGTPTAAIYQSGDSPMDLLIVMGIPDHITSPGTFADGIYSGMSEADMKLKDKAPYSAGPMGGTMWCAEGSISSSGMNLPVGICDVTDGGGSLMMMYFQHSANTVGRDLINARPSIEH